MTKDRKCSKNCDIKILGMTKACEIGKRYLETEKERRITFHQIPPPTTTAVNDANENLESI